MNPGIGIYLHAPWWVPQRQLDPFSLVHQTYDMSWLPKIRRPAGSYCPRGPQRARVRGARVPKGMGSYAAPLVNGPVNCSVIPYGQVGLVDASCWCLAVGPDTCDQVKGEGSYNAAVAHNSTQTVYPTAAIYPRGGTITQSTVFGPWTAPADIQGTDWGALQQAVRDHIGQVSTGILPPTPPTALTPISIAFIGIGALALVSALTSRKGRE